MSSPGLVILTGPQDFEISISFTLTNVMVAGQIVPGTIQAFGPFVPISSLVQVPITEVWHIVDVYTVGGPVGPDANIQIFLNGYQQQINPKLSSCNLNLITRFQLGQTVVFSPASTVSVSIVLLAAPVANATQLLTLKSVKSPYTG